MSSSVKSSASGGALDILVLPGDGIGPEITEATVTIVTKAAELSGCNLKYTYADIGFVSLKANGTTITDAVIEAAKKADGTILGTVSHNEYPPTDQGGLNPSGVLRKQLDLYANIRPARIRRGFTPRFGKPFDLVVARENTEGLYADRTMFVGTGEFMPTPDLAISLRKITRVGSTRIAETAFKLAGQRRNKITAVHKANVLRVTDGLFLECVREVASRYPHIEYEEQLIDSMAALLIRDASVYDVIVTTNAFGDILSDEASELAGSLGLAASLNAGAEHGVAQAQHGSAPTIAGQDIANPTSLICSAAMLLAWLGEKHQDDKLVRAAAMIETAVDDVLAQPELRTRDLGGSLGTKAFTAEVSKALKSA